MTTTTQPDAATITIDGIELPIKPTPLAKISKALPFLNKGFDTPESVEALAEAVFHGIRRAGGQVTQEFVSDNIDLINVECVLTAFLKVNGLEAAPEAVSA